MNQPPTEKSAPKKWLIFLIILIAAAVIIASVAAVTIDTGHANPMKLNDPEYPGLVTEDPANQIIDRPVIYNPDPVVCLYGCPNPAELTQTSLTKSTEVLDYD